MEKTTSIPFLILIALVLIVLLISKLNFSNKLDIKTKIRLLPFGVKFMGITITIFSVTIHWINMFGYELILAPFWQLGFNIGFLLICLSKERSEDEMVMQVRLIATFITFFVGIILYSILLLLKGLVGEPEYISYTFLSFTNSILITYLFIFYSLKRKSRR